MTAALIDLARRLVACPRWRWMGGMFWVADDQRSEECPLAGRLPHYPGLAVGHDMSGAIPDLTDPATIGCLLALAQEVGIGDHIEDVCVFIGMYGLTSPETATALVEALEHAPPVGGP